MQARGSITFEMAGDIEGQIRWELEETDGGTRVTLSGPSP